MIPLSVPNLSGKEWDYVKECLETGWISSAGSFVDKFEATFANYVGTDKAVSVVNGTSALHLSLKILGVAHSDLVIMPNVTFVASANAISYLGAEPILIDIEPSTWQMDLNLLEQFLDNDCEYNSQKKLIHIQSQKKITALMIVHVQGNICDMERLLEIAKKYNLPVLEDAAEALGSKYESSYAGTIADIGCYSFNGNKIMSTGGGGMIVSKHTELIDRAKHLSTTAKKNSLTYYHDEVGYNYRLVNILSAVGLAQIECLDSFIESKLNTAEFYRNALKNTGDIKFQKVSSNVISNEWLFTILTSSMSDLLEYLNNNGVMCRPFWIPMNQLPMYKHCIYIQSEDISRSIHQDALSLPCSTNISQAELNEVVDKVKSFYKFND
jgi:perosamine synthetase